MISWTIRCEQLRQAKSGIVVWGGGGGRGGEKEEEGIKGRGGKEKMSDVFSGVTTKEYGLHEQVPAGEVLFVEIFVEKIPTQKNKTHNALASVKPRASALVR